MYNTHIHTFLDDDVPDKFLPFGLVKTLRSKIGNKVITKVFRNIFPFTDKDALDRYAKYLTTGALGSQQKVFEKVKSKYPTDTKFVVLSVDMAYMSAGKASRHYVDQIKELGELKKKYPENVVPFFHADPRRKNVFGLFKMAVEEYGFKGLKLYPPMGYFPYDKRLYDIYQYCSDNNLPVIVHCSPYNAVHYKGSKRSIKRLLKRGNPKTKTRGLNKKELCSMFTNPLNYVNIIKRWPKLKICFAHFGSEYSWDRYLKKGYEANNWMCIIEDLICKYPNFYTDISFTLNNKRFFPLLKNILHSSESRKKVLFGSDYYMVETESNENVFLNDLNKYIGDDYFECISETNPKRFLDEELK